MSEPAAHIAVQGLGTTGFQVVRHLQPDPLRPVWVHDPEAARRSLTLSSFPGVRLDRAEDRPDLVVQALPGGLHGDEAERALGRDERADDLFRQYCDRNPKASKCGGSPKPQD